MSAHQVHNVVTDVMVRSRLCKGDRELETFIRELLCEIETDYYHAHIKSVSSTVTDSNQMGDTWWTVTILFDFAQRTVVDT